jgi:glycosyltransferase involved in cell wall biosynthesis
MIVALLAPRLPPACDGVGDHAAAVARSLARNGHRVVVFSETPVRLPAIDVSLVPAWNVASIFRTLRELRARRVELLLVEYTPFNFGPRSLAPHGIAAFARLWGIAVGVFLHEGFYGSRSLHRTSGLKASFLRARDAVMVAASNATFTASEERRRDLHATIPWLAGRLHVVPIGANVEPEPGDLWEAPPGGTYRFVTFGVVGPKRRLEPLVRMLAAGAARGIDVELIVIGRVWDRAYAARCTELARELGVEPRLRFTGSLEPADVTRELLRGHLAVTALLEGVVSSSGSLLALLAHGLPVLAVRTPHDEPGFDGVVAFTSDDPSVMLDAALAIVSAPDGGADLGRRARARYERAFQWHDIAQRALSLARATSRPRRVVHAR